MRRSLVIGTIGVYFLALTKDAFRSYFDPDACMNLYRSWAPPLGELVKANLLFFENSTFYRPFASLWYRGIFALAGFDPIPFVAATLAMLMMNIWVTYALARRLSGSQEIGAFAALLIAYHGSFGPLYFDLGFTYDVLCYLLYFGLLLWYVRIRQEKRQPEWWETACLAVLYICALNSKEIAVTFPAALIAFELLYGESSLEAARKTPIVMSVITVVFAIGRMLGGESLLALPAYQPVFTWSRFMETNENFLGALFWRSTPVPAAAVLLVWFVLFAIAWVSRSRALRFAWLFLMFAPIPVAFILPRGPAQYYLPLFGWVLYEAVALGEVTKPLVAKQPWRTAAVFLALALALYGINRRVGWVNNGTVSVEGEAFRTAVDEIHRVRPALKKGAHVLFLGEPFEEERRMLVLMRLSYQDRDLTVDGVKFLPQRPDATNYDYVFDYWRGRFYTSAHPRPQQPEPAVAYSWGRPGFFHADWTPLTLEHPGKHGELVISMMEDLGATEPAIRAAEPFPDGPFAEVTGPVEVLVDGRPAQVSRKFGWPGLVNKYRVDFRIPSEVRSGSRPVVVTAQNSSGPPTPLPVD